MIRTLVVDDDFRVAAIHSDYVRKVDGFEVCGTAHTAREARAAIAGQAPDLVLLDLFLPDEHGLGVLTSSRSSGDAAPDFIVVTAARDVESVRRAMQLGAVHYLVKPFGFAQIRERLTAYRQLRHRLSSVSEPDQADIDALFGALRPPAGVPPKGHSAPTMRLIQEALASTEGSLSAAELASITGISRATAQRYLAQLERQGVVEVRLRYGATGRPEHRYVSVRR